MTKQERFQATLSFLQIEDARDRIAHSKHVHLAGRRASGEASDDDKYARELLDEAIARLEQRQIVAPGVPVAQAAGYLGVSEPTVRKWLAREVLAKVSGAKPVLVERESLRSVKRSLDDLREHGKDREWLRDLVDLLHDQRELASIESEIAELKRGAFEPA